MYDVTYNEKYVICHALYKTNILCFRIIFFLFHDCATQRPQNRLELPTTSNAQGACTQPSRTERAKGEYLRALRALGNTKGEY